MATSPAIAGLAAAVAAGESGVLDAFWSAEQWPLVEQVADGERLVTFCWRGEPAEVAGVLVYVNRLTDERNLPDSLMRRVPGTDVWHLTYRMSSAWRASYGFLVQAVGEPAPWLMRADDGTEQVAIRAALDAARTDPRNPAVVTNRIGHTSSVVSLPDAPAADWLARRADVARGSLTRHAGPDGRGVWAYLPAASVGPVAPPVPLIVLLDGEVWVEQHDVVTTLDNLVADGEIPPSLVVLPHSGGVDQRWRELDESGAGLAWIADELIPWVRGEVAGSLGVRVSERAADVVVGGQSLGGFTALRLLLERGDVVGNALAQSASLWMDDLAEPMAAAQVAGALRHARAYVEVGLQEWVLLGPNRDFAAALARTDAAVEYVEYDGGHDYACWRVGLAHGLRALLGGMNPPPSALG